jgi:hypothetical protein
MPKAVPDATGASQEESEQPAASTSGTSDPHGITDPGVGTAEISPVTPEVSAPPSPPKRSGLFGMSRWLTITVIAGAVVIVLAVTSTFVVIGVRNYNEARAASVSAYEDSFSSYDASVRELDSTVLKAQQEVLSTHTNQLTEASLLSALKDGIAAAKKALSDEGKRGELDEDGSSNDELDAGVAKLDRAKSTINASKGALAKTTNALTSNKEAKHDADEAARKAEEAARLAAELAQKKANAQPVVYENLFRAGDSLAGNYYRFEGKIIQDVGSGTYRVNMTKRPGYSTVFWEDTILVVVAGATPERLLEDDIVSFVAASTGIESYQTVLGATVELPAVLAEGSDVSITGRDS